MEVNFLGMDRQQLLAYVALQNRIIESLKRELKRQLPLSERLEKIEENGQHITIGAKLRASLLTHGSLSTRELAEQNGLRVDIARRALGRLRHAKVVRFVGEARAVGKGSGHPSNVWELV